MEHRYPNGYSMPFHHEEYPPPPYHIGRVSGANFLCKTTPDIAATLAPTPLKVNSDNQIWLYFVHLTINEPVSIGYHEIGVFVPVTYEDRPGFFCLALFLDHSLPITIGREIWGFPKKIADFIVVDRNGNACEVQLKHGGVALLDGSFSITENETRLSGGETHKLYTHRVIPSWDPARPSLNQVVELNWIPLSQTRWEAEGGVLTAAFPESSQLRFLNEIECIESWFHESDGCTLEGGTVIRDFVREL